MGRRDAVATTRIIQAEKCVYCGSNPIWPLVLSLRLKGLLGPESRVIKKKQKMATMCRRLDGAPTHTLDY